MNQRRDIAMSQMRVLAQVSRLSAARDKSHRSSDECHYRDSQRGTNRERNRTESTS